MKVNVALALSLAIALACTKVDAPQAHSSLDAKMKCARQGRDWLSRLEKEQEPFGVSVSRGQFAYDAKFDTCLCYYYLSRRGTVTTNVTDILSEKDVLTFMSRGAGGADGPPVLIGVDKRTGATPVRDLDDFDARVRALGFEP